MIDKTFINKIEELVNDNHKIVTDKSGKEYSAADLKRVYDDPRPRALGLSSLDGLVDYIKSNVDGYDMEDLIIHIIDYKTVELLTKIQGETNRRHTVLSVQLDNLQQFPFGRFLDQQEFIIKCGSMFQDADSDLASIIKYTAKIDVSAIVKTEDDGISQTAQIKKSVSGVVGERESIPSKVLLKPFRTFQELDQPESEFLFRMNTDGNSATCALIEADGGAWVRGARKKISAYLEVELSENIPIIS